MTPEPCPDRVLVALTGADVMSFVQGLITNDIKHLSDGDGDGDGDGLIWTALLTPQGKYLADFFVGRKAGQIFLDLPGTIASATQARLMMYRLRADVKFAPLDWPVGRGLGDGPSEAMADPRHPALGWRSYGAATAPGSTDWDAIRVAHLIPETGIELIANDSYILETSFERLHGVDFRKGCYVGQEVTARMKHKTELRKGLGRVEISGAAEAGTPILTEDGKDAGTLHTRAGDHAIAYLRFDRATGPLKAGAAQLRWLTD